MDKIEDDEYAKELIKKVKELEKGLDYYIKHSQQLENELNQYKIMYENRVEEYLKLKEEFQVKENSAKETLKKMKQSIEKLKNRDGESMLMVDICIQNIICFYEKWEANGEK